MAGGRQQQDTAPHQCDACTDAADTLRRGLAHHDLASMGVRDRGPLNWTPEPPGEGERLEPVAIAQERVLARRRVDALERRWRQLRQVVRYWSEAA